MKSIFLLAFRYDIVDWNLISHVWYFLHVWLIKKQYNYGRISILSLLDVQWIHPKIEFTILPNSYRIKFCLSSCSILLLRSAWRLKSNFSCVAITIGVVDIFINRQIDNREVVKGFESEACGLMAVVLNWRWNYNNNTIGKCVCCTNISMELKKKNHILFNSKQSWMNESMNWAKKFIWEGRKKVKEDCKEVDEFIDWLFLGVVNCANNTCRHKQLCLPKAA